MKRFLYTCLIGTALISMATTANAKTTKNISLNNENKNVNLSENYDMPLYDLPILDINTEGAKPIVSKDYYLNGTMKIIGTEEFTEGLYEGNIQIKGRGNSTWGMDKKPYRIKLSSKSDLLGMEEEKDWVLLANYADKTLIRNKLALDLAYDFGMEYTSDTRLVEVLLNGEYIGNYILCEQVEVSETRIDIDELEDTDTDEEAITGGYFFEVDYRLDEEAWFKTELGVPMTFKSPKNPNKEQFNYITSYINDLEKTLASPTFTANGKHYSDYIDVDSFVDYYLINEIFKNYDAAFRTSVNMYKPRGGKISMGPVWDFDISAGNMNMRDFLEEHDNSSPEGWWIRYNGWYVNLFKDPEFVDKVQNRFWELIDIIDGIDDRIDKYAEIVENSQIRNFKKWDILDKWVWPNVVVTGSYEGEINYLKTWLNTRIEWMKNNMGTPPESFSKLDLNKDRSIDIKDLSILSKNCGKYNMNMDFNEDGKVNEDDIQILIEEILK